MTQKIKGLQFYLDRFAHLRVDRAKGTAPHKPTLLLCVIELAQQGLLTENRIRLTPELITAFLKYWALLAPPQRRSDISLPFWHLASSKFWHLKARPGFDTVISSGSRPGTIAALQQVVAYAFLDDELFLLLQDAKSPGSPIRSAGSSNCYRSTRTRIWKSN
jgi:putative restriction endonuclease